MPKKKPNIVLSGINFKKTEDVEHDLYKTLQNYQSKEMPTGTKNNIINGKKVRILDLKMATTTSNVFKDRPGSNIKSITKTNEANLIHNLNRNRFRIQSCDNLHGQSMSGNLTDKLDYSTMNIDDSNLVTKNTDR